MFRKILVANDGSAGASSALGVAIELAGKLGCELGMICVEEIPRFAETIDEVEGESEAAGERFVPVINQAKERAARKGLSLNEHLVAGHPVASIIEFLRAADYDLLVLGFMGHSALYNRIVGSTTDRLVDHAPCAVLVVK